MAGLEQAFAGLEQASAGFEQGSANYLGSNRILRGSWSHGPPSLIQQTCSMLIRYKYKLIFKGKLSMHGQVFSNNCITVHKHKDYLNIAPPPHFPGGVCKLQSPLSSISASMIYFSKGRIAGGHEPAVDIHKGRGGGLYRNQSPHLLFTPLRPFLP